MKVTVEVSFVDDRPGDHATIGDIAKDFEETIKEALDKLESYYLHALVDCRPWRDMDTTVRVNEISATTRNKEVLT